jgi:hypothetical protein
MSARGAKQRLDLRNVTEDERTLIRRLAVVVRRLGLDAPEKHVDGCAQEDNRVEA